MAPGREIISVGEAATVLYDDMSINNLNGLAFPIVVEPGDTDELIAQMSKRAFYMYAPQFHWTMAIRAKDKPACSTVENIAPKQFKFRT